MANLLALRTILLNMLYKQVNGESLSAEAMQRLIERADADKLKKAVEPLKQAEGSSSSLIGAPAQSPALAGSSQGEPHQPIYPLLGFQCLDHGSNVETLRNAETPALRFLTVAMRSGSTKST